MPTPAMQKFTAGPLTFIVGHELWDGNLQDHADQGVSIVVAAEVEGKQTALLRFNCFDIEKSYVYGPKNAKLHADGLGTPGGRTGSPQPRVYRTEPFTDGNPIGWTVRTLGTKLDRMLE